MKFYYILKDFFMSRYGKIFASSILIIIATIFFSNRIKKEQSPINQQTSKRPSIWESDISHSTPQSERNIAFEPFTPITSKPKNEKVQPPPSRKPPTETPQIVVQQLAPLIKVERKPNQIKKLKNTTTTALPQLESGAIIHCRLLTPATTDQPNIPVIAQITRPVIRNGITLIPKGRLLHGQIQNSQNNRIFFSPSWITTGITNSPLPLTGYVQQKSLNSSDGRLGLVGAIIEPPQDKKDTFLKNLTRGVAQLGKETVRSRAGDYLPATGKNIAIEAGSQAIDHLLPQPDQETVKRSSYILIRAGREFYLTISKTRQHSFNDSKQSSLDKLLEEAAKSRLK